MTTAIVVSDTELVVEPRLLDKILALHGTIRVPLGHVRGATHDPGMRDEPRGWRGPGLAVPGKYTGTFHAGGERRFYNVEGFDDVVVIELDPSEHFTRLVVSVDDPRATVEAINAAIGHRA